MEDLSCKTIRPALWDYAAKVLAPSEHAAIDSHLDSCLDCDRCLTDIASMRTGFRHLPVQPVPPLVNTKLQVIASRERSRQLLRNNPAAWLRDKLDRALLSFDRFLKPYAVPATGGLLASCFCFTLIAHSLQLRPYLLDNDMPIGLYSEMTIDNASPFSFSTEDITVEVTVDAKGTITDFKNLAGNNLTREELEAMGGFLLYTTFRPAIRSGQPVASKRLLGVRNMNYKIDSRGIPHQD